MYLCVDLICMYLCVVCACECHACGGQKRTMDPLNPESQVIVSYLMWVLRNEFLPSRTEQFCNWSRLQPQSPCSQQEHSNVSLALECLRLKD